ncbi:hypothetical protein DMB66_15180 [Actinoplanes sp. ATCC 53533]|uniref:2TM domain-containing protein n=1 Tax=Actinoplanes sp. ATCC 53533 TaxID=1288362 RepID=UPI000F78B38C|nr:2TM domain-containing protein [Actinoplanes sp. ATCC 53533]RSM67680.1 hypothetical protein DMB66_15180 [Actinoplanes sp. ATCC 53533]
MIAFIVACEIGFWVLLGAGLAARYLLRARALSTVLLICVPLIDVVLLAATAIDLRRGGEAGFTHGLAAVYIGVSLAYGHQLAAWADQRFAHRFAGGPAPVRPPRTGRAHAARERQQWLRHLLAYAVAAAALAVLSLIVGDLDRTLGLWAVLGPWGIGLVIDFIVSFSYTLRPRT